MFNALPPQICFQEVPNEIALAFTVTGCPLACPGCHSQDTWDPSRGTSLTHELFEKTLLQYQGLISCVLFFGGEWQQQHLIPLLALAQQHGLKTCLYTGKDRVSQRIRAHLDYLKTGRWEAQLGGLDDPRTNQRFWDLNNNNLLNTFFQE